MNEPIRHHYIPQFILRNFCFDDKGHLYYYDKSTKEIAVKSTKDVFMTPNLYRDEINYPDDRTRIEYDFAAYEQEIASLLRMNFLQGKTINIGQREYDKLVFFLTLLAFRSENAGRFFKGNMSRENRDFYSPYQKDGNMEDLWKRNLGHLVKCRSAIEALKNPNIDEVMKLLVFRDDFGIFGRFIGVVDSRDSHEFVISDACPTVISGRTDKGVVLELYSIYPISSKRALLLIGVGAESAPQDVSGLRNCVFKQPEIEEDASVKLVTKSLHEEEILMLNSLIIKTANIGVAFRTKELEKLFSEA